MSNMHTEEVLELKEARKKLTKGIRLAVKQFGADAKEVSIARAALTTLDSFIAEEGYGPEFSPAIVSFANPKDKSQRERA